MAFFLLVSEILWESKQCKEKREAKGFKISALLINGKDKIHDEFDREHESLLPDRNTLLRLLPYSVWE